MNTTTCKIRMSMVILSYATRLDDTYTPICVVFTTGQVSSKLFCFQVVVVNLELFIELCIFYHSKAVLN